MKLRATEMAPSMLGMFGSTDLEEGCFKFVVYENAVT